MAARVAIVVMLVLFASGAAAGYEVLSRLGYAILGFLGLAYLWARLSVRDLELTRTLNATRFAVGEILEEQLVVANPGWWPFSGSRFASPPTCRVTIQDMCSACCRAAVTSGWYAASADVAVSTCSGHWNCALAIPLACFPRYASREPWSTSSSIHLSSRCTSSACGVASWPAVERWRAGRSRSRRVRPASATICRATASNRVHWPSTARVGRLMVKEFEPDPTSDVWLVLDLDRQVQVGNGDDSTEEYGIKIAASLAMHLLRQERAVGFIAAAQRYEVMPPDRGARQGLRLLEELALLRASGQVPLARVLEGEALRFGPAAAVLIITPSLDLQWVRRAHQLATRGLRVAAVLVEPSTFGAAETAFQVIGALASAAIPSFLVKRGDALDHVLVARSERTVVRRR